MSVTVLHNPLGQGEDVRLEADGHLYMDRAGSAPQLLDDHCRAVAAGVDPWSRNAQKAIYDLKNDSSKLYDSTDGFHWQLLDDGAGQIAQGMLTDGRLAVWDLKKVGGQLYTWSTGGYQLMAGGVTEIAQGVLWDGRSAVFAVFAVPFQSSILHAYSTHGFEPGGVGRSVNYHGSLVYETDVHMPLPGLPGLSLTEAYSVSNGEATRLMMLTTLTGAPL
jgi:hypothetical protein